MKEKNLVLIIVYVIVAVKLISKLIIYMKNKPQKVNSKRVSSSLEYNKLLKQMDDFYDGLTDEETNKIKKQQAIIEVVQDYYNEVMNGGLCQYFVNSSRVGASFLSKCLNELNAKKHKKHFDNFIKKNEIDVNDLDYFISSSEEEYLDKYNLYPFETYDEKFYDINDDENLEDLIFEYAKNNFSKMFSDCNEVIDVNKMDLETFVKKYYDLALLYPEYLMCDDVILKVGLKNRVDQFLILKDRLKENDAFAREVIDILMETEKPVVLCEICLSAIDINYRKEEAIKNAKDSLEKIDNEFYRCSMNLFLSKLD